LRDEASVAEGRRFGQMCRGLRSHNFLCKRAGVSRVACRGGTLESAPSYGAARTSYAQKRGPHFSFARRAPLQRSSPLTTVSL